jgi:hypothetical protein
LYKLFFVGQMAVGQMAVGQICRLWCSKIEDLNKLNKFKPFLDSS